MKRAGRLRGPWRAVKTPLPEDLRFARLNVWINWITLICATVVASIAAILKLVNPPSPAVVPLVVLTIIISLTGLSASLGGRLLEFKEKHAKYNLDWEDRVNVLLRQPLRSGHLPLLTELSNAQLGATPTRYTAAGDDVYVSRELDEKLVQAMRSPSQLLPFVVLSGHVKSGKTRTLAEVARRIWPNSPVVVPTVGNSLTELHRLGLFADSQDDPIIVWLDDLSAGDLDRISGSLVQEIRRSTIILCTITTQSYNDILRTGSAVGAAQRAILHLAVSFELEFDLTPGELKRAAKAYPLEDFWAGDGVSEGSIGETLVGGEELLRKLVAGRGSNPAGYAIVVSSIDCRHAGLLRPLTTDELRRLFPLYLRRVNAGLEPNAENFDRGMSWALEPVASQVALFRASGAGWDVLEYVVANERNRDDRPKRLPSFLWTELLQMVSAGEALSVGTSAYFANYRDVAIDAFRIALTDPASRAAAYYNIGVLLEESGQINDARCALQSGLNLRDPEYSPRCAVNLGLLLEEQGDLAKAQDALRQGISYNHPEYTNTALYNLKLLLSRLAQDETKPNLPPSRNAGIQPTRPISPVTEPERGTSRQPGTIFGPTRVRLPFESSGEPTYRRRRRRPGG